MILGSFRATTLIHHSDRGSQYCSELYQSALQHYDISPSMTDGGDCYQNALAERVNGINSILNWLLMRRFRREN